MNDKYFKDKIVLITGSSRGIGLATASEIGQLGAKVVMNARGEERLNRKLAELKSSGIDAMAIPADVSSYQDCKKLIGEIEKTFGRLDILVNNAGISMRATFDEIQPEVFKQVVDINLMGSVYPTLTALPLLKKTSGQILFISSPAGYRGFPTASAYCASKGALRPLMESLRCELHSFGIHVGIVYVGFTENDPEKRVIASDGSWVPPDRPMHQTQQYVAKQIVKMLRKRKRQLVLTPAAKLAVFAEWLFPCIFERLIVFGQQRQMNIYKRFT